MEARGQDLAETTEGLMHSQSGSGDLEDRSGAATADAREGYSEAAIHVPAAHQAGLVSGVIVLLLSVVVVVI